MKIEDLYNRLQEKSKLVIDIGNEDNYKEIIEKDFSKEEKLENTQELEEIIWQIEIPEIELIAPIAEGISQEVMLEFVGHFEDTSKWNGNIGLAAHNRGYPINYFSRLKELQKGDRIIYKNNNGIKTYIIDLIEIIEDTNWSYLQET